MNNLYSTNISHHDGYVVEIDGKISAKYGVFQEALNAGFELREKFPHSQIKVQDANE
jgi:hypothetical protein